MLKSLTYQLFSITRQSVQSQSSCVWGSVGARIWGFLCSLFTPFSKSYLVNCWPRPQQQSSEESTLTSRFDCGDRRKMIVWTFKASYEDYPYLLLQRCSVEVSKKKRLFIYGREYQILSAAALYVLCLYFVVMNISVIWAQETRCIIYFPNTEGSPEDDEWSDGSTSTLFVYFGRKGELFCTIYDL